MADATELGGRGWYGKEMGQDQALRVGALVMLAQQNTLNPQWGIVPVALQGQNLWRGEAVQLQQSLGSDIDFNAWANRKAPSARWDWPRRPGGFASYEIERVSPGNIGYILLQNQGVEVDLDQIRERADALARAHADKVRELVVAWYAEAGIRMPEIPDLAEQASDSTAA